MIEVQQEPVEITKEFSGLLEDCHFCNLPTKFWHRATNTPVCQECAEKHLVRDLQGRMRFPSDRDSSREVKP